MPLYEFQCNECGADFELITRFGEADNLHPCPECESTHTERKMTRSFSSNLNSSFTTASSSCSSSGRFT